MTREQFKGTEDGKTKTAVETTVRKVEGKEVEKVVVFFTGPYFFHVEACQGGSSK